MTAHFPALLPDPEEKMKKIQVSSIYVPSAVSRDPTCYGFSFFLDILFLSPIPTCPSGKRSLGEVGMV